MMIDAQVSPRFQRIAEWIRSHGNVAVCGANMHSRCEFVDIYSVQVARDGTVSEIVDRAHSKADAARILGY